MGFMLDWIRARRKLIQQDMEQLPPPPLSPRLDENHDCYKSPFPRAVVLASPMLPLEPCPACGHAILAHTYTEPCALCTLFMQGRVWNSLIKNLMKKNRGPA
jgi:ribosomal protein L32